MLVLCHYNLETCLTVFESWLLTMTVDGNIAHEQARGAEALFGIPHDFVGIDTAMISPPIMVLLIETLIEGSSSAKKKVIFKGLDSYYNWIKM